MVRAGDKDLFAVADFGNRSGVAVRRSEKGDAWPDSGLAGAPDLYFGMVAIPGFL